MPQATITITVVQATNTLDYSANGAVVPAGVSASHHKVDKDTDVNWECQYGFGILFSGANNASSPFTSHEHVLNAQLNGLTGLFLTAPKKAKKVNKTFKYTVAVAQGGNPPVLMEDPELEVTDTPGGGPIKRTSAKKKSAVKKKSAPKKRDRPLRQPA